MGECPFEIVSCSWPYPDEPNNENWTSEPLWEAPIMPNLPQPRWEIIQDHLYWSINWSDFFKGCELNPYPIRGGQMRGFYMVFRIKIKSVGTLIIWDNNGNIIRRNHQIIHVCRNPDTLMQSKFAVEVGDYLEIAQRHLQGEWQWYAELRSDHTDHSNLLQPTSLLTPYLFHVQERLLHPSGPPLKMLTHGRAPFRSIIAIYSMILNGYVPSSIYLFGEHQWDSRTRHLFASLLPFANVVPTRDLLTYVQSLGQDTLVDLARQYWFVLKACANDLFPPYEFCHMDDDVFILGSPQEALHAFEAHDLVYAPDEDLGAKYAAAWGGSLPLCTANFNSGLFWMRNVFDPRWLAEQAAKVKPTPIINEVLWEQGFLANVYADQKTYALPSQRYLLPVFDGLPGGIVGYDYINNPCGLTSIHFGGLVQKPSDGITLHLLPQLLDTTWMELTHL